MKKFVIGDIHGSNKALLQVLERSGFDKESDLLISLGDIADGWNEVPECVDTLLSIKNLIAIRGNHDVWCYDWFEMGATPLIWTQQGGKATLDAYVRTGKMTEDSHKAFWKNQVDWYIDDENRLFIHGGWDYIEGFPQGAKAPVNAGSIAKECHWDRSLLEGARSAFGDKNRPGKFKALEQFKEIYIGHTAMNGEPKQFGNLWNLDTGAGWNGQLTIMDIDTKEFWQSDNVKELHPDQLGRF
ncbi:MAG: serine/threonine protein phosphatase [Spirochaetes bacterium]|nr:MAG: serine/threonine protein phosphatase [Spirochaetota bacterium]